MIFMFSIKRIYQFLFISLCMTFSTIFATEYHISVCNNTNNDIELVFDTYKCNVWNCGSLFWFLKYDDRIDVVDRYNLIPERISVFSIVCEDDINARLSIVLENYGQQAFEFAEMRNLLERKIENSYKINDVLRMQCERTFAPKLLFWPFRWSQEEARAMVKRIDYKITFEYIDADADDTGHCLLL